MKNIFGKATQVNFSDGRKIDYIYDAAGNKLTMKIWEETTLKSTTDYVDGFVYEDNSLRFFASPEGRVVKNGSNLEYQYAIADNQGNTQIVFSSAIPAPDASTATFEGDINDQSGSFNLNGAPVVNYSGANHTPGGMKVVRLNKDYRTGPAKDVKVYPGDKIDIEVWEYQENSSGFGTTSTPLSTLITSVAGAFGGVSGAPGESGMRYDGVNSAINTFGTGGNMGDSRPPAYLNYILFDKNYKVLDAGWKPAPAATFTKQKLSFPTMNIKEEGYIFTWLSYDGESSNWAYFDDFKVTHTKSNIIQYNEYYPFGLEHSSSWTRSTATDNNYLYNAGSELNEQTGNYETYFRNYDPATGRFTAIDIRAELDFGITPYAYAGNNPVFFNDPLGDTKRYPSALEIMDDRKNTAGTAGGGGGGIDNSTRDYFMMSGFDFQKKYGQSTSQDIESRKIMNNWNSYVASLPANSETRLIRRDDGSWGTITYVVGSGFIADGNQGSNIPFEVYKGTAPDGLFAQNGGSDWLKIAKNVSLYGGIQTGFFWDQAVDIGLREGRGRYEGPKEFLRKQANLKSISKITKGVSLGFTALSVGVSFAEFTASDQSGSDYARLVGTGVIIGTNFIPYVGPLVSTSLAIADATGQFDSFYNGFDNAYYRSAFFNSLLSGGRTTIGPFKP